jgi:glycerophosphoryl diester phosphodiesterase
LGAEFAGTRIPTLDEALNLLAGRCLVNIEVKSSAVSTVSMGRDIVAAIRSRNMEDQVLISSFNPFTLRLLKTEAPDIETAYLTAPDLPLWMRLGITRSYARADGIHPEYRMVSRSYMSWARRRGKPVRVWTVDDQADAVRMAHLGVDAIITNVPDTILAVLKA